jgi:hypothetical protein
MPPLGGVDPRVNLTLRKNFWVVGGTVVAYMSGHGVGQTPR